MITIIKMDMELKLINGILYIIYARKSSEDNKRQIVSIPQQLDICYRKAEIVGIKIPDDYVFTDTKTAMKAQKRRGFDSMRMLIELAVSRGIKVVIISWDAARLARNNEEGGYLVDRVRDEQIKIYTEISGNYDETNYTTLNIHFGSSSEYSKKTSQGVIRNMKSKVEKGICPTAAHIGYMFNPAKEKGEKDVIKNPVNWDKCREWVELMLTGQYKVEETLEIMTARGLVANPKKNHPLQPVSRSRAYTFFKDIYNTGLYLYHGEIQQGIHTPLMTMAEYNKIQDLVEDRGSKKADLEPLPHIGQFQCGCGCNAAITGERHLRKYKNGENQLFCYYRSSRRKGLCKEPAISDSDMKIEVEGYTEDVEIVPEFVEWLKKVIKRQNQVEYHNAAKEQELQTKKLADITKDKFQLKAMKDEGYFPDENEYQAKKEELLKKEQLIKQEIVSTDDSYWDALFEDTLKFANEVKRLYETPDPVIKRMVIDIIGLNFKLKDKKLKIKAKNAFIAIHRVKKELWEKNLWIEPEIRQSQQPKFDYFDRPIFSGADERS